MAKEQNGHKTDSLSGRKSASAYPDTRSQPEGNPGQIAPKRKRKLKRAIGEMVIASEQPAPANEVPVAAGSKSEDSTVAIEALPRPPKSHSMCSHKEIEEGREILSGNGIPIIHFDAESGTIRYLKEDNKEPEYVVECSYCGAVVPFDLDKCPICNRPFDEGDTGIVSLVADADFDSFSGDEMNCPSCGEHVLLIEGRCPACMEIVNNAEDAGPDSKVSPVIRADNVVFLHLDVESGELNYLQRLADKLGFGQLMMQFEDIGRGELEKERRSISKW